MSLRTELQALTDRYVVLEQNVPSIALVSLLERHPEGADDE